MKHTGKLFPPGHFYSPYADLDDVAARRDTIFDRTIEPQGIDLRTTDQHDLLAALVPLAADIHYGDDQSEDLRYSYNNGLFGCADATLLYLMMRHLRPKRIIEVGSGWTSALMLDTVNQHELDTELTFIEPHTERLESLLRPTDRDRARIVAQRLQAVDLGVFDTLQDGDILFVDSTHVAKTGSDVNLLFFDVLPRLAPGVHVHLHDIFYPFEYPEEWINKGRAWNECYMLRSFLQFNTTYAITLFGHMMQLHHHDWLAENLPLMLKNPAGSFWMRRNA